MNVLTLQDAFKRLEDIEDKIEVEVPKKKTKKLTESYKESDDVKNILDTLGIDPSNRTLKNKEQNDKLVSQYRYLHKKFPKASIWLSGDEKTYTPENGKKVGNTEDLIAIEEVEKVKEAVSIKRVGVIKESLKEDEEGDFEGEATIVSGDDEEEYEDDVFIKYSPSKHTVEIVDCKGIDFEDDEEEVVKDMILRSFDDEEPIEEGVVGQHHDEISGEEVKKHEQALQDVLKEITRDVYLKPSSNKLTDLELVADIHNGDWKHDHLAANYLVDKYCDENGLVVVKEKVENYDDSEDDTYSATHTWLIDVDEDGKGKERLQAFQTMFKPVEEAKKDVKPEQRGTLKHRGRKINEGVTVDLLNDEDIEKGKEELEKKDERPEKVEKIVDVDANTIDELKDSYVGNAILQCPICRTLVYKKPDALKKADEENIYNKEETCPHCGSLDGYLLVGQVATYDTPFETEEKATTGAPDEEEIKDLAKSDGNTEVTKEEETETEEDTFEFESLDQTSFDGLVKDYLTENYSNVKDYKSTKSYTDKNQLFVEGMIEYVDGKKRNTKFVFEETMHEDNRYRFKGLNEAFSKDKGFTLISKVNEGILNCNILRYKYKTLNESTEVKGSVSYRKEK